MADSKQVKAALAALADGEATQEADTNDQLLDQPAEYRTIIERASNATDDIDAAATFIQEVGVTTLETAVADAERELSGQAEEGREALTAFKRFRAATDSSGAKRRHS